MKPRLSDKQTIAITKIEVLVIIAVIAISLFIAIFKMKFTWENNEQLYKELKHKEQLK